MKACPTEHWSDKKNPTQNMSRIFLTVSCDQNCSFSKVSHGIRTLIIVFCTLIKHAHFIV